MNCDIRKTGRIILASSSPRRKTLFEEAGLRFDVCHADINEDIKTGETPQQHCLRLAEEKAVEAAKKIKNGWIIGADTIVFIAGRILGKPSDANDARKMLGLLSDRQHSVFTGFCILNASTHQKIARVIETTIKIKNLSRKEIEEYVATEEPLDKAGAYAIQGAGSFMVENVKGSFTNVVGLPMDELMESLKEIGAIY